MADWMGYPVQTTLLDLTVTKFKAGVTQKSNLSSTYTSPNGNTEIQITNNTVNGASIPNGQVADATDVIVIPPVLADGTTPDVEFWFEVDGQPMDKYSIYDGSADGNMFPFPMLNVGRRISLGDSLRKALVMIGAGKSFSNVPYKCTGLKITQGLRVVFKSVAGWGPAGTNTSTVATPLRVIVLGDTLDRQTIDPLTRYYLPNSFVNVMDPFFGLINLQVPNPGQNLSQMWNTLPGGIKQGSVKINRRILFSTNGVATSTSNIFTFTNSQKMLGSENNVSDQQHDLGDDFSDPTNNNIFVYDGLGVRLPSNQQAYVGFNVDGNNIPNNEGQAGKSISTNLNFLLYGAVQPVRSESNLYYGIPNASRLTNMVVRNNAVVPFINTTGTTAISAGDVKMAKTGVLIEQN